MEKENDNSVLNSLLESKYIIRKTGEEVEVIAHYNKEDGARSDGDWVSYIDSAGVEHIKEPLNIQFDFKMSTSGNSLFEEIFKKPNYGFPKFKIPSQWATWKMDLVKLLLKLGTDTSVVVVAAREIADELKQDPDFQEQDEVESTAMLAKALVEEE